MKSEINYGLLGICLTIVGLVFFSETPLWKFTFVGIGIITSLFGIYKNSKNKKTADNN